MSLLDQLPGGRMIHQLHEDMEIDREIKAPQTLGSSSVETSRVFSEDAYDIQTPSGSPEIEVEFIPDDLTFGGAFCYRMYVVDVTSTPTLVTARIKRLRVEDDRQRWHIGANPSSDLKFYFFAAGSGTFTVNLL
jgi:hypothetical protein